MKKITAVVFLVFFAMFFGVVAKPTVVNAAENNMISNGTFDTSLDGWHCGCYDGSEHPEVRSGVANIVYWWIGQPSWDGQAWFNTVDEYEFVKGKTYTISFDMSAAYKRTVRLKIGGCLQKDINLTTNMQKYAYSFTPATTQSSNVTFLLGDIDNDYAETVGEGNTFYLDNVVLIQGNDTSGDGNDPTSITTREQWIKNVIITPESNKLVAAGYIDISWCDNVKFAKPVSYKIYVDDKLVDTVQSENSQFLSTKWYSTKVSAHTVYVEGTFNDGTTLRSDKQTFYITKKGICLNNDMARKADVTRFNLGWYYNWSTDPSADSQFEGLDYVPMLWGNGSDNAAKLKRLKNAGYTNVLGFNEPEDWIWQSRVSIDDALTAWKDFSDSGLRVGSPATALNPKWSTDWFQPFMRGVNSAPELNVDFIAIHHYWDYTTINQYQNAALDFLDLIDWTYEVYGKPVWITEFAIGGDRAYSGFDDNAKAEVYKYMNIVIEGLNQRDYVERYSWFAFDSTDTQHGASGLFNHSTGELTKLGKLYADMGNPSGYNANTYNEYKASGYNTTYDNPGTNVDVTIDGFQISTTAEGFRTVYTVNDPDEKTMGQGLIYGLEDVVPDSYMIVNSTNKEAYYFDATSVGLIKTLTDYMKQYAMTMELLENKDFYNSTICVRAYARLVSGEYIYSDIKRVSVYQIADYLYQNQCMNSEQSFAYLYNKILSVANSAYKKKQYNGNNTIKLYNED